MKPTRLLIVSRSLPFHNMGGMEAVVWDLTRAFQRADVHVSVLTTACAKLPARSTVDGVEIECLDVPSGCYSAAWWRESVRAYRERYDGRVDVVLSASAGASGMLRHRGTFAGDARFVMQAHGTAWGEMISKVTSLHPLNWARAAYSARIFLREFAFRKADLVVSVGPGVTRDMELFPMTAVVGGRPVHEIQNGIDTSLFRFKPDRRAEVRAQLGLADGDKVMLCASRLHVQKGIQHAVAGFEVAAKQDPSLRLVIAGEGDYESQLRQAVEAAGLTSKVVFAGGLRREMLPDFYSAADVFLFTTTRIEGMALNVLEALACGLPAVVSNHVVMPDVDYQFAVNPRSPAEVARAIAAAAATSVDRRSLLPPRCDLDNSVKQYLDVFKRLRATTFTVVQPALESVPL